MISESTEDLMTPEEKGWANEKPHIRVQAMFFVKRDIQFSSRYAFIFGGKTSLKRGRYSYRYIGEDVSTSRLVHDFVRRNSDVVTVNYQFAGSSVF